ncbi:hypothetical protein ACFQ0Q_37215 [Streptomyces aureus]
MTRTREPIYGFPNGVVNPGVPRKSTLKRTSHAGALRGGRMHTSDLGYIADDGRLYIADRLKAVIITGAENVYSAEVENPLAQDPAAAHAR